MIDISANLSMSSDSGNYINLSALNTFTGPITLNLIYNNAIGILVVSRECYWIAFGSKFIAGAVTITPGKPTDHDRFVIPNLGGKFFARIKAAR